MNPAIKELCDREQAFVLKAIREDINLDAHMGDAIKSLGVVLAAHKSIQTGTPQKLEL